MKTCIKESLIIAKRSAVKFYLNIYKWTSVIKYKTATIINNITKTQLQTQHQSSKYLNPLW